MYHNSNKSFFYRSRTRNQKTNKNIRNNPALILNFFLISFSIQSFIEFFKIIMLWMIMIRMRIMMDFSTFRLSFTCKKRWGGQKGKYQYENNTKRTQHKYWLFLFLVFYHIIEYSQIDFFKSSRIFHTHMKSKSDNIIFADNKKALFDYEIIEEYEAGVKLLGEEVKSVRNGNINLKWSYILITKGYPMLIWVHISELQWGMRKIDPKRDRNLLLTKREIKRLEQKTKEMWATLVPLSVYSKGNLIKIRIALAKGKKTWQKREIIKTRDLNREMAKNSNFRYSF